MDYQDVLDELESAERALGLAASDPDETEAEPPDTARAARPVIAEGRRPGYGA